jgi:membrane protein implicated in regulation of membrane protease activity
MNWELFYLVCFVIGFAFAALSFLTGTLHLHFHLPYGHIHGVGHGGAHGGHFPFFNPLTLAVFLAWFGGTGYLLTRYQHLWMFAALVLATLVGLAGSTLIFLFVAKVLMAHDYSLDPMDYEMVGVLGKVSSGVRPNGTGEIIFEQDGCRKASAARSESGEKLVKGEEVVVTRYESGIAYVRRWEDFADAAGILPENAAEQKIAKEKTKDSVN